VTREIHGVGLALRWEWLDDLVDWQAAAEAGDAAAPPIDFLEVSPENYMKRGGRYPDALAWLAERYPIVTHGLTLSLGGTDPLDHEYLEDLARVLEAVRSPWHSDHMCFSASGGRVLHELLPVSYKHRAVARIADRVREARDALSVPLAVENVSAYWHPGSAELGEAEFLRRVCEAADCGLLLDVNNAYVNCINFGLDIDDWMAAAPLDRVTQIHVAGHEWFSADERGLGDPCEPGVREAVAVDTHGADAPAPVLRLLERVLVRTGPVPVLLERDHNIPPLRDLIGEVVRIREIAERLTRATEHDAAGRQVGQKAGDVANVGDRPALGARTLDAGAERIARG
jgi:uncharacterized protein (UPF0276 family)